MPGCLSESCRCRPPESRTRKLIIAHLVLPQRRILPWLLLLQLPKSKQEEVKSIWMLLQQNIDIQARYNTKAWQTRGKATSNGGIQISHYAKRLVKKMQDNVSERTRTEQETSAISTPVVVTQS